MKRIGLIALVFALLAAGCGEKPDERTTATTAVTPADIVQGAEASTGTTLSSVLPKAGATGTTAKSSKSSGQAGATTTTPTSDPSVTMKLDSPCVKRGETQGLTATSSPDDTIAWSTEYADHSNEMTNPAYKTGSGYGKTGSDGRFHTTWVVPVIAPTGDANVHTIAKTKLQPVLTFRVVGETESC